MSPWDDLSPANGVEPVRMYSLLCTECLKVWFSTVRDRLCPYCHEEAVADTGRGNR